MNYNLLDAKIKETGYKTHRNFAKAMGMSEPQMCLFFKGKRDWRRKDILKCMVALNLSPEDLVTIFFGNESTEMQKN